MAAFRSFNNSTCEKVLNLLESGYLRLGENIVMMFGVNSRGGSHTGCCGIEVRMNTLKMMQ